MLHRIALAVLLTIALAACTEDPTTKPDAGSCGPQATAPAKQPDSGADSLAKVASWQDFDALATVTDSDAGKLHSLKFLIFNAIGDQPAQVYFVNRRFALHYDFAHAILPAQFPTRNEFDRVIYAAPGQPHPHVVGTLLWYPELTVPPGRIPSALHAPVTIWFFPTDDLPLPAVIKTYQLLRERMPMVSSTGNENRLLYTPSSGVQEQVALANAATLTAGGVQWLQQAELLADLQQQSMNHGVTFGTLRAVPADQLLAGMVSYRDIIVLDRLPLDLPLVGGTLTEEFQTPLAHVNVAAKTRGTPNLALRNAREDPRVKPLLGQPVRFEVFAGGFSLRAATPDEVTEFWAQKQSCQAEFHPKADLTVTGVHDMEAENRGFGDSSRFGVKACNYAELHRAFALWDKANPGHIAKINQGLGTFTTANLAVAFAEYDRHVSSSPVASADCAGMASDCAKTGDVDAASCLRAREVCLAVVAASQPAHLKAYIHTVLARTDFQADSPLRAALLLGFRWKIEHTPVEPVFAAQLDAMVGKKFPGTTVRLRSSTNAEDLRGFTGAGLYDSFSATASGAKRASVRIVKTWGSIWTFRAFEERSWWRIAHEDVYMGVQINPSFPDEVANGVLVTRNLVNPGSWGFYVNAQKGEESVTNPLGGITPEVSTVTWRYEPDTCPAPVCTVMGVPVPCKNAPSKANCLDRLVPYVSHQQWSSLSPGVPLLTDDQAAGLTYAVLIAQWHLAPFYGTTVDQIAFEIEWKLHDAIDAKGKTSRHVYLKQIRPF